MKSRARSLLGKLPLIYMYMSGALAQRLVFPVLAAIIVASLITAFLFFQDSDSRTAFADADAGIYAVVSKPGLAVDTIAVIRAGDIGYEEILITIPHLPGMSARGVTSPDGTKVALIVADEGDVKNPVGSLRILDLMTGSYSRLATGVDLLQQPVWSPDSEAILVTVSQPSKTEGFVDTAVLSYPVKFTKQKKAQVLTIFRAVILAVPLRIDQSGDLFTVAINERGSLLFIGDQEIRVLSRFFTRDWALSSSGRKIAFIEANLDAGLQYLPRVESVFGGGVVAATVQNGGRQALGAVWKPSEFEQVDFGDEPSVVEGQVAAAGFVSGFDIPLSWAETGDVLLVEHWSGINFEKPGDVQLQIVLANGRYSIVGYTRFLGWVVK